MQFGSNVKFLQEKRAEVLREITKEMEQQNDTAKGYVSLYG